MSAMPPVSIVGLGKLGASMVAAIASRGGAARRAAPRRAQRRE
jgi:prephenate dehydrogenase